MDGDVVVLPTYNEAGNIEATVRAVFGVLPQVRVVVVDDNSPDGTADIVERLAKEFSNLTLYKRIKKAGLGAAYKDILSKLQQDPSVGRVVHMDADGSHNPSYLPDILKALKTHDLVIGSRYVAGGGVRGWEKSRIAISWGGNLYARTIAGLPLRDVSSGFMGMRKELLERINFEHLSGQGYAYLMEFKYYCTKVLGCSVVEIPIRFLPRREGESKLTLSIAGEGLMLPLRLLFKRF